MGPKHHISYRSEVIILMVWGPPENHLTSVMDFPHRDIKICNGRVHTYLFFFSFFKDEQKYQQMTEESLNSGLLGISV